MGRIREMEMFVRVVDGGSFSAAARDLNMGQPAVSKAIAGLEDRLSVRLLVRSTRRLSPTDAGIAFYERALRAIAEANEAAAAAQGLGAGLEGRLRISAPVTFSGYMLFRRSVNFSIRIRSFSWNSYWTTATSTCSLKISMPVSAWVF